MRNERGFTLIELIIVMVVLGIMAALAIPKFFNISEDAKYSAVKGSLGGVRSAVANFHAKNIAANPADATPYPDKTELETAGTVMDGPVPDNPYYTGASAKNSIATCTTAKGVVDGVNTQAWCYKVTQPNGPAEFWANTANSTNTPTENAL